MRVGVLVLGVLLTGAASATGEEPAPDAALAKERSDDPLTTLERGALKRCARVVVARATVIREAVGSAPALVRVEVERDLYTAPGADTASSFPVFVGGPPPDTPPDRFYAPYFRAGAPARHVLFLAPTPSRSGWSLYATFPVEAVDGEEKVSVLEKEIALTAVRDPAARRAKTLAHLVALLGADRPWSRLHAARELAAFAAVAPEAFGPAAVKEIAARRARTSDARAAALLGSVLARFPDVATEASPAADAPIGLLAPDAAPAPIPAPRAPPPSPAPAGAPPAPIGIAPEPEDPALPPPPVAAPPPQSERPAPKPADDLAPLRRRVADAADGIGRIQALTALAKTAGAAAAPDLAKAVADADPAVREQAALLAGDVGATDAWAALEAREATEDAPAVRDAIVRAAGLFRDPRLVPWVVKRGVETPLRRTASFALARIRTPEALGVLARWRDDATAAGEPGPARLVEYLTSEAFARVERQAGRDVGPR